MAEEIRIPKNLSEVMEYVIEIVENSETNALLKQKLVSQLKSSILVAKPLFKKGDRVIDKQYEIDGYTIGTPAYFPDEELWKYLDHNSEYLLNEPEIRIAEEDE